MAVYYCNTRFSQVDRPDRPLLRGSRSEPKGAKVCYIDPDNRTKVMTLLTTVMVILTGALLGVNALATTDPASVPARVPYGVGERLVFSIDYGPISAGEGVLEVKDLVESDGHLCYQIESSALSNRIFSNLYKVRDRVISHIDVFTLFSRYFSKRINEGGYKRNVAYSIDHDAAKVRYADGKEFDIAPGSHDVLSAFYFVRSLELEPGQDRWASTHSNEQTYDLRVIVHRRERVEVPAGQFDCIVIEPILVGEGLFKQEGVLTIWLTDDERRMPVLMKTRILVGSIDASLKEYRLGQPIALIQGERD